MDLISSLLLLHFLIAVPVCAHIVLTKTDTVAPGWLIVVLLSPFLGSGFYFLFGINRVVRRARRLRGRRSRWVPHLESHPMPFVGLPTEQQRQLFQFGKSVHAAPFLGGNRIEPLVDGAAAYPEMLAAIEAASRSIALSVYIFECDEVGDRFIAALTAAHRRGIAVRVLVDEIGSGHRKRAADQKLAAAGIMTARFIPQSIKFLPIMNLRNHRKIMIADDAVGFIGGMNICRTYSRNSDETIHDLHFRVTGPVLGQMVTVFEEDWRFATGRTVELPVAKFTAGQLADPVYARVIVDGPDNTFQRTLWVILGALAVSQKTVHILTPYFLPNEILRHALAVAALRGVSVEIIVPGRTDIVIVDWAMEAHFQELLEHGVKIYVGGPPFDHSKLMVVDGVWALAGSSNWDQRSFRLNFEANIECYDAALAQKLEEHFAAKRGCAKGVVLDGVRQLPVSIVLRNAVARLFAPYL
jgi:cardiolipin synthase